MGLRNDLLQQLLLKGANNSAEAAQAGFQRAQQAKLQKEQQDAALSQLLTGNRLDQESAAARSQLQQDAIDANSRRSRQEAARLGLRPGQYSASVNESGYSLNPEGIGLGGEIAKGLQQSQITGFNIANPNIIPTAKDAEEVKKAASNLKALQNTGTAAGQKLKDSTWMDRLGSFKIPFSDKTLGTSKGMAIDSDLSDMKMQLKELYALGAITGPDESLMNAAMGSLANPITRAMNQEEAMKQLTEVLNRSKAKVESQAVTRGYSAQPGYLDTATAELAQPVSGSGLTPEQRRARLQQLKSKQGN